MYNNYPNALSEVNGILKYIEPEERIKIPQDILNMIEKKMNKQYEFYYDTSKKYEEQNLLIETKAIIANLFRDYIMSDEERKELLKKQAEERKKLEQYRSQKYDVDEIFKHRKQKVIKITQANEKNTSMQVIPEEKWYKKIFNIIKKFFKKNK